jgi:signal transduction histidine kinase
MSSQTTILSDSTFVLPSRPPDECKILIADDEERIVEAFSELLSLDGFQTIAASTGTAALKIVSEQNPDVVILDVLLPGLDGIEVCRVIKSDHATHFTPVILVTGLASRERRLDGLKAGADEFLDKPIDPLELTARVRSLLRTKQLSDANEAHRQQLEQRVAERTGELQAANQRLTELARAKSRALTIVAHELRTPLLQAKMAAELSRREDLAPTERQDLYKQHDHSMRLLEQHLEDIRVFADPADLKVVPVSVGDLIQGAAEQTRRIMDATSLDISLNVPKGLDPVAVDVSGMTRALRHLIHNAVKFGEGAPVSVTAEDSPAGIRLTVADEGPGIPPELIPVLFQPLQQGDDSSTRRFGGLGLGLALVKTILDAHHIDIDLKTAPGKGTTFTIVLPRAVL